MALRGAQSGLRLFGFDITRYEHLSDYNGLPTRKKLQMLTVEKGLPASLHDIINDLKQVYTREEVLTKCRPVFEKEYMLSRLRHEGYRLAVCSNAIADSVELMIRQSGLHEYFEFLVSNEDVTRPKPDPEIYTRALERMGVVARRHGDRRRRAARRRSGAPFGRARVSRARLRRGRLLPRSRGDRPRGTARPAADRSRRMIRIVVPMGGEGRQFVERGYTFPKPLIEIDGKPLIELVVENLTPAEPHHFVFVCRQEHVQSYALADVLRLVAPGCRRRSACGSRPPARCAVCCSAMEHLATDDELLVANADQIVDVRRSTAFSSAARAEQWDGYIMTFPNTHPRWSYVRTERRPGRRRRRETAHQPECHGRLVLLPPRNRLRRRRAADAAQERLARRRVLRRAGLQRARPAGPTHRHLSITADQMHGLGTPEEVERLAGAHGAPRLEIAC